ncbi:hypothetical protein [Bradyrhizobium sp. BR 1433]
MTKPPLIILDVSNPAAFSGTDSIIILEYTDEDTRHEGCPEVAGLAE